MPEENILDPENWFDQYYEYLFNYACTRVSDIDKVKDLIQETFIAALRSMKNFKSGAKERTWLTAILKHKIIDHYRYKNTKKSKAERRMVSHEEYYDFNFKEVAATEGFESQFELEQNQHMLSNRLRASIKRLPEKQAKILEMKYLLEYDTETICEKLDISKNSVWVLAYRAKRNLASDLQEYRHVI